MMARMQKAMAVIQFKLAAQIMAAPPRIRTCSTVPSKHIDLERGTVRPDGQRSADRYGVAHALTCKHPYALSHRKKPLHGPLSRLVPRESDLVGADALCAQRRLAYLIRDNHLIFHGCVPVDERGELSRCWWTACPTRASALFEALNTVVHRAFREKPATIGPLCKTRGLARCPRCSAKTRWRRLRPHFIEDKTTHKEKKNPYFSSIRTPGVLPESAARSWRSIPAAGMIVNGHVPVMVEKGERPLKDSRQAITIDGAFSEAYGDRGYTLILDPEGTHLAEHHHFESIEEALTRRR